jgi:hypothetical protein
VARSTTASNQGRNDVLKRSHALVGYGCAVAAFLKGLLDAGESAAEAYGLDGM